jgi:hypothetical protein
MRTLLILLSLLALPSPALAQARDAIWTLDEKHVLVARERGPACLRAAAAKKHLALWIREQAKQAKEARVFVVERGVTTSLMARLRALGHKIEARKGGLGTLSPKHAEVMQAVEDLQALEAKGPQKGFSSFAERREQTAALTKRLRKEPGIARALCDVLLVSKNRGVQVFLAKTLGGLASKDDADALQDALWGCSDLGTSLSLVRSLPASRLSLQLVGETFKNEKSATQRSVLIREYGRRLGPKDDAALLGEAAEKDSEARVRAEATTILGRRNNPRDFPLLSRVANKDKDLSVRLRATVAAAEVGGDKALGLLEGCSKDPSVRVRATAVLALGRVGSPAAETLLRTICDKDPNPEVRTRASRLLAALRARKSQGGK